MARNSVNGIVTMLSGSSFERSVARLKEELHAKATKLDRRLRTMFGRCPHSNPFKCLQSPG
jgi:hypothetical protein